MCLLHSTHAMRARIQKTERCIYHYLRQKHGTAAKVDQRRCEWNRTYRTHKLRIVRACVCLCVYVYLKTRVGHTTRQRKSTGATWMEPELSAHTTFALMAKHMRMHAMHTPHNPKRKTHQYLPQLHDTAAKVDRRCCEWNQRPAHIQLPCWQAH